MNILLITVFILFFKISFIYSACYENDLKFGDENCMRKNVNGIILSLDKINDKNCKELYCTEFFEDLQVRICVQKNLHQINFMIMHSSSNHLSIKDIYEIPTFKDTTSYSVERIALLGNNDKDLQVYLKMISLGGIYQLKFNVTDLGKKNFSVTYLGAKEKVSWRPLFTYDADENVIKKDICFKTSKHQLQLPVNFSYNFNIGFIITLALICGALILLIIILIILCCKKSKTKCSNEINAIELQIQTPISIPDDQNNTIKAEMGDMNTDNTADSQKQLYSEKEQLLNANILENTESCETENEGEKNRTDDDEMIEKLTTFSVECQSFKNESLNWENRVLISYGTFGNVYKCLYIKDDKCCYVAVKEPKKESQEAFREAEIMTRLDHPHIIKLITTKMGHDMLLVMPLLKCSLYEFLYNNTSKPNITKKIRYCQQIAQGMTYLMFRQIVHCDLKASNVLVVDENFVQISDLGKSQRMSSKKRTIGTITHTAKELLDPFDRSHNSEATDIWSFGVTIWEIFNETEQIPYKDILKRVTEVTLLDYFYAKNHLETTYWPPKETSDALVTAESYMKRCLVHRQEFRPSFDKLWHLFETMLPEGQRLKCNDEKCEKSFSDFDSN